MMHVDDIVRQIEALQRKDLEAWINEELISPRENTGALLFSDIEVARIHLICTLRYELEIDAETLPTVLSLVDQLYDTRKRLLKLAAAVAAQDPAVQAAILAELELRSGTDERPT